MDEKQNVHNIYPQKISKIVLSLKISPRKNDSTFTVLLQNYLIFLQFLLNIYCAWSEIMIYELHPAIARLCNSYRAFYHYQSIRK